MIRNLSTLITGPAFLLTAVCLVLPCGCSQLRNQDAGAGSSFGSRQSAFDKQRDLPPSPKTLYSMAQILAKQGKDRECEYVLRRCIQQYPRFTPAHNSLAELQMRQGRLTEAVDVLAQALQLRPADPVLLNNSGMSLLVHQEYDKALERFTAAAGQTPTNEKYRANLATCLGLMGRHEESLVLLQQILPEDKAKSNVDILRTAHEEQTRRNASPQS